jgi:hypothetical protein
MESEWEIKSRAQCCARTGKQFGQEEYFYTLLFRDGEGFRREDISEEAWANRNENIEPFSFWRSKWGTILSHEPSTNEPAPAGTSAGPNFTPSLSSVDSATSKSTPYSRNPNSTANTPPPKPWPRTRKSRVLSNGSPDSPRPPISPCAASVLEEGREKMPGFP